MIHATTVVAGRLGTARAAGRTERLWLDAVVVAIDGVVFVVQQH